MTGRILEARRPLVSSFDPDEEVRARRPARALSAPPADAIEAAIFAGFQDFTREPDPDRALKRFGRIPERTKQARRDEFTASLRAYIAAGGRA